MPRKRSSVPSGPGALPQGIVGLEWWSREQEYYYGTECSRNITCQRIQPGIMCKCFKRGGFSERKDGGKLEKSTDGLDHDYSEP